MSTFRYSVVLDWDAEERLYVATVPALSISTYGKTRDEALENERGHLRDHGRAAGGGPASA